MQYQGSKMDEAIATSAAGDKDPVQIPSDGRGVASEEREHLHLKRGHECLLAGDLRQIRRLSHNSATSILHLDHLIPGAAATVAGVVFDSFLSPSSSSRATGLREESSHVDAVAGSPCRRRGAAPRPPPSTDPPHHRRLSMSMAAAELINVNGGPTITTTSLADDLNAVAEILLRLPSPAALVRAALASTRWRQVASSPVFLRRYRSRHPSPPLLGLYAQRSAHAGGLPSFQLADSVRFVRAGDFNLTGLDSHPEWRLLDCHNSRLLLSRGESRAVYDPVSGREPLWFLQNSPLQEGTSIISECLLQGRGDDAASFRVVSVEHRGLRLMYSPVAAPSVGEEHQQTSR
ncbi:hypothetical protein HU200_039738 [Digitaria exilis]|uniref:F-box domain-containing protein n=1 Tax=Digitaria exilis TaxID=1010633 RepID=A0A835B9R7_9POAL|nr:hypothetical protein HU200_039738 [Digitaria exilis]